MFFSWACRRVFVPFVCGTGFISSLIRFDILRTVCQLQLNCLISISVMVCAENWQNSTLNYQYLYYLVL